MLGQVGPTEFDLRFSFLGIPVRVHPLFWVAAVVLGFPRGETGGQAFALILVWTACLFVSILVHEMGHALDRPGISATHRKLCCITWEDMRSSIPVGDTLRLGPCSSCPGWPRSRICSVMAS